jgi:hypothetical protein
MLIRSMWLRTSRYAYRLHNAVICSEQTNTPILAKTLDSLLLLSCYKYKICTRQLYLQCITEMPSRYWLVGRAYTPVARVSESLSGNSHPELAQAVVER